MFEGNESIKDEKLTIVINENNSFQRIPREPLKDDFNRF